MINQGEQQNYSVEVNTRKVPEQERAFSLRNRTEERSLRSVIKEPTSAEDTLKKVSKSFRISNRGLTTPSTNQKNNKSLIYA
jgi:hypothetical protein